MTRKLFWYVCLGLLCCGLGALVVNAAKVSSRTMGNNGMTNAIAQNQASEAEILAMKAARQTISSVGLTGSTPETALGRTSEQKALLERNGVVKAPQAASIGETPVGLTLKDHLTGPQGDAARAYANWRQTGTKTAADASLMEQYIFSRQNQNEGRNGLDATGGPDAFGYRFVDNQGGDTATFSWTELCGDPNATDGPSGDDNAALISWGWNFPYYGLTYTSAYITTNGRMTMNSFDATFSNSCIDGNTPAQPYIAPYWDDLYAAVNNGCDGTGAGPWIRYRDFGDRLVVQWQISHFAGSNDNFAYEMVLYPNGKIKFQYDTDWNDSATPNSATIGLDDVGAGNGLQYTCDGSGPGAQITGGRAIWFYLQPITGVDLRVTNLAPCLSAAPNPTQSISLRVTNWGLTTSAATTARFSWDGGFTTGTAAVPALGTNGFADITFATTVNSTLGAHTLVGHVDVDVNELASDTSNNTQSCNINVSNCLDNCVGVVPVPLPATFDCNNSTATHTCNLLTVGEGETWHAFTLDSTCDVRVTECGLAGNWGDFYIVLVSGCPCQSLIFFSQYTFPDPNCPNGGIDLRFNSLPPGTYYYPVLHEEAFGSSGDYHVEVSCIPPCQIDEQEGDLIEVEFCDPDNGDVVNGGCNSNPVVDLPMNCGQTYFGTSCATSTFRDTDWYSFSVGTRSDITLTCESQRGVLYGIVDTSAGCASASFLAVGFLNGDCVPQSITVPCVEPGATYFVFVAPSSFPSALGEYRVTLNCAGGGGGPANDNCENATEVGVLGGTPIVFNGDNTGSCEDCSFLSFGAYADSWYRFTTTETCSLRISMCGTTPAFGNVYIVLVPDCPCSGTWVFADTWNTLDCVDGNWSVIWYDLPAGTYYYPILKQTGIAEGPYTVTFGNCGTICDEPNDLRIYYAGTGAPHTGINLFWSTAEDMLDTLHIWYTDSTDADFDADQGADPDWHLQATIFRGDSVTNSSGITTRKYYDPRPYVRYRRYQVTRTYCFTPPPPPPPCLGDSCELNETIATNGVPILLDNTCAGTFPGWPCGAGGKDVWVSYTSTAASTITVSTCSGIGTLGDTVLEAWTDCPNNGGTSLTCVDDFCGVRTQISWTGAPGVTYKIRMGGFGSGFGSAELVVTQ